MDPNAVVLEISSDEETDYDDRNNRGITDRIEDHNWITAILDEVNRDDCRYDRGEADDDSDEVVIVSEVLPSRNPRKKSKLKSSSVIEFDDDCVVLDHDPNKPLEIRNDDPINHDAKDDDDDDSDDLVVVSEKGQVACRDYPHSRHLCIKFPFSSTPKQSHCQQCYCYVCDSLAPCVFWGNGSGSLDHCHATDKDDFWKLERVNSKKSKNGSKVADTLFSNQLPAMNTFPPTVQNPAPRQNSIQAFPVLSNFGATNVVSQNRTPFLLSRNKYEPGLVSQQLIRTSSCTFPADRAHHNYNLHTTFNKPVFKRTVSDGFPFSLYPDDYRNLGYSGSPQPNAVNTSDPFSPPLPMSNTPFDFPPNFQPSVNPSHTVSSLSQPQGQPFQQENQGQRSTVDPKFFCDISWPQSKPTRQPTNGPSLATGSGGAVDYEYDNWMLNNQPCEPRSTEVPDLFGLNEFSHEPDFIDTGIVFDF